MANKIGNKDIIARYIGNNKVIKQYLGTTVIYEESNSGGGEDIDVTPYTLSIDWSRNVDNTTSGNIFYTIDGNGKNTFYTATTNPYTVEIPADTKEIIFHNIRINEFKHFPTGLVLNDYTSMFYEFQGSNLILNDVNMGGVTSLKQTFFLFGTNNHITTIDFSGWKFGNATSFSTTTSNIFSDIGTTIRINRWYIPKLTSLKGLFTFHNNVERLYAADIDMSNITDFSDTFRGCEALHGLDVSNWNVNINNVVNTQYMFNGCLALRVINIGKVTQEQYDWWYQRLVDAEIQDNVTLNHTIV